MRRPRRKPQAELFALPKTAAEQKRADEQKARGFMRTYAEQLIADKNKGKPKP